MLNKLKDNMTFSFYADSTFQVKNENDVINGKWWMNNKEKLLFTFINGQQTESKILLLKKSELQFVSSSENNQPFTFYCVPAVTNKK